MNNLAIQSKFSTLEKKLKTAKSVDATAFFKYIGSSLVECKVPDAWAGRRDESERRLGEAGNARIRLQDRRG